MSICLPLIYANNSFEIGLFHYCIFSYFNATATIFGDILLFRRISRLAKFNGRRSSHMTSCHLKMASQVFCCKGRTLSGFHLESCRFRTPARHWRETFAFSCSRHAAVYAVEGLAVMFSCRTANYVSMTG